MVHIHQHWLLSQIASPIWFDFCSILVLTLCLFLCVDIIFTCRLQGSVSVAFDFEVRVSHDYVALWVIKAGDRPRDQKVRQLNLEELCLLMQNKECAIDRLNYDHGSLVLAKVADQKVERVPLNWKVVNFLELREGLMMDDKSDSEFSRMQDSNCSCFFRICTI